MAKVVKISIKNAQDMANKIQAEGDKAKKDVNTVTQKLGTLKANFTGERAKRLHESIKKTTIELKQFHEIITRMAKLLHRNAARFKAFEAK